MTRMRLREIAYLTEVTDTTTQMISEVTALYTRLMEVRRQLVHTLRRTIPYRSLPLAPTVHPS